jgi:ABC-2 type transport system ATP-binding protein
MADTTLRVDGVSVVRDGRQVLREVSLDVEPGRIVALLGPNGAGKTTLMEAITGRVALAGGRVLLGPADVARDPRALRRAIGYAGQEVAVFPTLTVAENVTAWAALGGVPRRSRGPAVRDALDVLFLGDLAGRAVHTLSGGERRRVHCAMAMVTKPPVLMLDEPTVGVDPTTRAALLDHVGQLAAAGTGVLYSTHYLHEVEKRASTVVMLRAGEAVARGPAGELISRHCRSVIEIRSRRPGEPAETLVVPTSDPAADLGRLLEDVRARGQRLLGVEVRTPTLEDAFTQILAATGRESRHAA